MKKSIYMIGICMMISILSGCSQAKENIMSTPAQEADEDIIKVGLLFSTTGTSAVSEKSMLNAAVMALDEINENGGIHGKKIKYIHENYASDPATAKVKIKKLITRDKVVATIGCYTSASRKAVLSTLEKEDSVLIYPTYTEGEEEHANVIYTGAMPNQQATEYVPWLLENCGKNAFFIGNDYVFSVTCSKQAKMLLEQGGGKVLGEEYVQLGQVEFSDILEKIKKVKPDFIYCDLVGDSTIAFYKAYAQAGLKPEDCPIASITTDEMTIQELGAEYADGHYSSMNYFSVLDTPENQTFVRKYNQRFQDGSAITALAESAYTSCYILKEALDKVDNPKNSEELIQAFQGVSFNAPEGVVKIADNHCMWMYARFAKIENGSFRIIYESEKTIEPEPWPGILYPEKESSIK